MSQLASFLFLGTLIILPFHEVEGRGSGAPQRACQDMFPAGHGVPAQNSRSPYVLDTDVKSKDGNTGKEGILFVISEGCLIK